MKWLWLSLAAGLCLTGCYFGQLPDPNDYNRSSALVDGRVLQRNIVFAYQELSRRVSAGEISERTKERMLRELVQTMASYVNVDRVPNSQAYAFADVLRQAGELKDAETLYRRAVKHAKSEDRRVNDSLQLARVLAMQGKVDEAIETARSTFDCSPTEKAPILMAVLYEITPAALGKGKDLEVAKLLIDAIDQQMRVIVDPKTEGGEMFLTASPSHVNNAWQKVLMIYRDAKRDDLMRGAIKEREDMAAKYGSI